MFKTYLKESLNYIIDHFAEQSKKHFNVALSFWVLAVIAAVLIAFVYLVTCTFVFGYGKILEADKFWTEVFAKGYLYNRFLGMIYAITIFSIGLYGSFVISCINDSLLIDKPGYTLKDFRQFISAEEWRSFYNLLAVLVFFYFISFKSFLAWFHYDQKSAFYLYQDGKSEVIYGLLHWLDAIIDLIRAYLPFICAILFILSVYGHKLRREVTKEYSEAILAALFLAFCINTVSGVVISYINLYILGLVEGIMPMSSFKLIPGAIEYCVYIGFGAYFTWAVAAALCLPIKLQAESEAGSEEPIEDTDTAELPL